MIFYCILAQQLNTLWLRNMDYEIMLYMDYEIMLYMDYENRYKYGRCGLSYDMLQECFFFCFLFSCLCVEIISGKAFLLMRQSLDLVTS